MELLSTRNNNSRRRFLGVSVSVVGILMILQKLQLYKPKKRDTKTRFLTRDGLLVEVDNSKLPVKRKVASKQQLVSWIWKHQKI